MTMPNAFGPIAKQPAEGGTPSAAAPHIDSDRASAALTRPVVFLGPLPPPHNGFSAANQRMLERIRERAPVEILDVAKRSSGSAAGLKALGNRARQLWRLGRLIMEKRPHTLYLGLSGGLGQLLDAPFVALASLAGMSIYFHHHSFAYINRPTWYTRLIMGCAPRGRHLVLCDMMGAELSRIYGLAPDNVQVLSNLSLIDLPGSADAPAAAPEPAVEAICVGFLSNITAAKGIFTFFEVVRLAQEIGMPVCARIAGPVAPDIRARFDAELARTPCVRYLGAVHGAQKEAFFHNLDALLFPTNYHNEAAPLILLEAHSHGVPVIAYDRGCIGSMIDDCNGVLVPRDADFAEYAIAWLRERMSPDDRAEGRRATLLAHFQAQRQRAEAVLDRTVAAISTNAA